MLPVVAAAVVVEVEVEEEEEEEEASNDWIVLDSALSMVRWGN